MARAAGGDDLLHRRFQADAVEGEVHAGHGLAGNGDLARLAGEGVDRFHGVRLRGVHAVGCAEALGELQLGVVQIHGDDRIRAAHSCPDDRRKPHAANAEDGDRIASPHVRGVEHGTGAGHHRAADDGGDVAGDFRRRLDHELLVRKRVVGPGEDVLRDRFGAPDIERRRGWRGAGVGRVPGHPGDEHGVAFVDVGDRSALLHDDAGGFVAEQRRAPPWPVHLMQLGVADAGGVLPHHHLGRPRIGQLQFPNFKLRQRAAGFPLRQDDDLRGRGHLRSSL